ncbi:hypothetical protein BDB00DRAFT_836177 [Zychaea mexicana]|uniref:uncharacterized protein n=1 Tax=Zychaea mexicana TaxID=64656 RepID=UPI0022FDB75B|nr:uncharacterized protein BDB00DRAFT_836177 [Zychaea mexicana]KAI9490795.1 hypothetical protein BDB00DRAFT_836177 [Zychaea mexicana]
MSAATFTPWSSTSWSSDSSSAQFHNDNFTFSSSYSSTSNSSTSDDDMTADDQCHGLDSEDWKKALLHVRQQMYSTTSVAVPSPAIYFEQMNLLPPRGADCLGRDIAIREVNLNTSVSDIGTYRQHRSDNLVFRMFHCNHFELDKSTIIPLGKGMYIRTEWQSSQPLQPTFMPSPQSQSADEFERLLYSLQLPIQQNTFVPYCYTFGVRFADALGYASDVLIRGRLPLWCQTLFLSECAKQMPIRPNETRTGLFVFAPEVAVTFQSLANAPLTEELSPELTLCYERLAMELSDPELLFADGSPDLETEWEDRKQRVIQRMVYCDIPDDMAQVLTDMATAWACAQGIML